MSRANNKLCRICLSVMRLDDVDRDSRGSATYYWICDNDKCNASCIEKFKSHKLAKEIWDWERDDNEYHIEENYNVP